MVRIDHWLVDKRVLKRHISNNLLTEKELKSYLSSLSDLASSAEKIEIEDIESLEHDKQSAS